MRISSDDIIAITPLGRYIVFKSLGLVLLILDLISFVIITYVTVVNGFEWIAVFVYLLVFGGFYLVSFSAFSRRARVCERGIVTSYLPFTKQFSPTTPILGVEDITEIRNIIVGRRLIGLGFETIDKKRYYVLKSDVGNEVFKKFLEFKEKYYST